MKNEFQKELVQIALPVTLQCLLQSSFSVVDQIMTGQLGSISIAGIGLGGKFASIYSVVIAAVASVAGIMIAQYIGKKDERSRKKFLYKLSGCSVCSGGFYFIKRAYTVSDSGILYK
jgi:Na+-driven multidrug efflux pump